MKESNSSPVLRSLIHNLHFSLSVVAGWVIFDDYLTPLLRLAATTQIDPNAIISLHMVQILAFGALCFLVTSPPVELVQFVARRLNECLRCNPSSDE